MRSAAMLRSMARTVQDPASAPADGDTPAVAPPAPTGPMGGGETERGVRAEYARDIAELVHEVNQPLAAIVNFVRGAEMRLRQQRLSPADLETALGAISDQAMRISEIVRAAGKRWAWP